MGGVGWYGVGWGSVIEDVGEKGFSIGKLSSMFSMGTLNIRLLAY